MNEGIHLDLDTWIVIIIDGYNSVVQSFKSKQRVHKHRSTLHYRAHHTCCTAMHSMYCTAFTHHHLYRHTPPLVLSCTTCTATHQTLYC